MTDAEVIEPDTRATDAANRAAERILALVDELDPNDVVSMGEQIASEHGGTLRGVGFALTMTRPGHHYQSYEDIWDEQRAPGTFRHVWLSSAIFDARYDQGTDALARSLIMTGDALWQALGEALADVRDIWRSQGGQ